MEVTNGHMSEYCSGSSDKITGNKDPFIGVKRYKLVNDM
jgi:hypothetical protein